MWGDGVLVPGALLLIDKHQGGQFNVSMVCKHVQSMYMHVCLYVFKT